MNTTAGRKSPDETAKELEQGLEMAISEVPEDQTVESALVRAQLMTQLAIARSIRTEGYEKAGKRVHGLVQHPGLCFQAHPIIANIIREQQAAARKTLH